MRLVLFPVVFLFVFLSCPSFFNLYSLLSFLIASGCLAAVCRLSRPLLYLSVFETLLRHWWKPGATSKIASVLALGLKGEITANEWSENHRRRRGRWSDGQMARSGPETTDYRTAQTVPLRRQPASGEEKCFHCLSSATDKWSSWAKLQFGNRKDVNHWDPKAPGSDSWFRDCLLLSSSFPGL